MQPFNFNYIINNKNTNNMKKLFVFTLLSFIFMTTAEAQFWGKRIKGNKNVISETRTVSDYDKISVSGSWDVKLVAGKEGEIQIKGEENILPYIETEVVGKTLKIRTQKGKNIYTTKPVEIIVPFQDLDGVSLCGSGSIVGKDEINSDDFDLSLSGSGDIELTINASYMKGRVTGSGDVVVSGSAKTLNAGVTGSGDFDARDLEAQSCNASVTGSGDLWVMAQESIEAKVTGSGDIVYYGQPSQVKVKTSGSGDVTAKN